jgi:hypothetical protein
MSLPGLNQGVIAVDAVHDTLAQTPTKEAVKREASAALTARAVVVVTFAGAGFWYLLWKLAWYFIEGR